MTDLNEINVLPEIFSYPLDFLHFSDNFDYTWERISKRICKATEKYLTDLSIVVFSLQYIWSIHQTGEKNKEKGPHRWKIVTELVNRFVTALKTSVLLTIHMKKLLEFWLAESSAVQV